MNVPSLAVVASRVHALPRRGVAKSFAPAIGVRRPALRS